MTKNQKEIVNILIEKGNELFRGPRQRVLFTQNDDANNLLNDIENYPHAFVLACIMDRQMPAKKVWLIPFLIKQKLCGNFSMERLCSLSQNDVLKLMAEPNPLHRFPEIMAENFYSATQRIAHVYNSDASLMWENTPPSAEVIYKFLEFKGVGPKIATMGANILARELKVSFSDYSSIDISVDTHVRRVFLRLNLTQNGATIEYLIYRARALHPEFPGLLDFPC